jgi:hypothetical protein
MPFFELVALLARQGRRTYANGLALDYAIQYERGFETRQQLAYALAAFLKMTRLLKLFANGLIKVGEFFVASPAHTPCLLPFAR